MRAIEELIELRSTVKGLNKKMKELEERVKKCEDHEHGPDF